MENAGPNTRTELSTGAKAGIGIGASLGVLFLAAIAGVLILKRRQRTSINNGYETAPVAVVPSYHSKAELQAQGDAHHNAEVPPHAGEYRD